MTDQVDDGGWGSRAGRVMLARAAAAQVATDFVRPKFWFILAVLAVGAFFAWMAWWPLGVLVLVVMAALVLAYWVLGRVIARVVPRPLRSAVGDVSDEVRDVFERFALPTGVFSSTAFAWQVARSPRTLAEIRTTLPDAIREIERLISEPPTPTR